MIPWNCGFLLGISSMSLTKSDRMNNITFVINTNENHSPNSIRKTRKPISGNRRASFACYSMFCLFGHNFIILFFSSVKLQVQSTRSQYVSNLLNCFFVGWWLLSLALFIQAIYSESLVSKVFIKTISKTKWHKEKHWHIS
jgi:hypothetical protein